MRASKNRTFDCTDSIENETRVILDCSLYVNIRNELIEVLNSDNDR